MSQTEYSLEASRARRVGHRDGGNWRLLHRSLSNSGVEQNFTGTNTDQLGDTDEAALLATPTIFAGLHYDESLQLYDARTRWLDPQQQRFLSEAPQQRDGNLYFYAAGDQELLEQSRRFERLARGFVRSELGETVIRTQCLCRCGFSQQGRHRLQIGDLRNRVGWPNFCDQLIRQALAADLKAGEERSIRVDPNAFVI